MNSCLPWELREQLCRTSEQQAQLRRRKELLRSCLCTGVDTDLKPQLMLNQSLEGKEELRREGKELLQDFPSSPSSALPAAAKFQYSIFNTQYSPRSILPWSIRPGITFPPQSSRSFLGYFFTIIIFSSLFCHPGAAVSSSSPARLTPAPIRRAANSP